LADLTTLPFPGIKSHTASEAVRHIADGI
jgi:hypothetical protein